MKLLAAFALLCGLSICGFFINSAGAQSIESAETIRLYGNIPAGERIPVITCLDFDSGGQILAIGGDDHKVRLWDVATRKFTAEWERHSDWIRSLAFSPDKNTLASVSQDGQISLWNVKDGKLLKTLADPVRGTQQIRFQPSKTRFAVCGFERNVRLYDTGAELSAGQRVVTLPAHGENNETIAFSPDGSLLAVAGRTGVVRLWQTSDNKHLIDIAGDGRRVRAAAFSPDGTQLAAGGDGPFIILWDVKTGKMIKTLTERPGKTFSLTFCGADILASGESDNMIRLWEVSTGKQKAVLSGHTGTISAMIYDTPSQTLISSSFDTSVRFWDLKK